MTTLADLIIEFGPYGPDGRLLLDLADMLERGTPGKPRRPAQRVTQRADRRTQGARSRTRLPGLGATVGSLTRTAGRADEDPDAGR
jgi:hypothetical protein